MNRLLRHVIALAGLAVIAWVGAGYGMANPLALALTALIGGLYLTGVLELRRFQHATAGLVLRLAELAEAPTDVRPWLERLPASLRQAVRRRIEGALVALPGPALATSLAALLVLLGMLGTFLGMVLTLRGTGAALESAADLAAVRDSLAAPVRGLGLAFGTSVAGVAGSAALGLLAALCRRERAQAAGQLEARIATTLRVFSSAHQRETSLALLQRQADQMPALVDGLTAMMAAIERGSVAAGAQLLAGQERFHARADAAYAGLAASVDKTLRSVVTESAQTAGESVRSVAEATLAGVARDTAALQASLAGTMQAQLDRVLARLETGSAEAAGAWQTLLARHERAGQDLADGLRDAHERSTATFGQRAEALLESVGQAHAALQSTTADSVAEMRERLADGLARDRTLLDERARLLETLGRVLDGVDHAATGQRAAIAALVDAAAAALDRVGERFGERVDAEAERLTEVAAQVTGSAVEVASLGEAFGAAVEHFCESNDRLGAHLQRIDAALAASIARSDDQLAHHVAQAREVIDLSLLSQRQIIGELQRLAAHGVAASAAMTDDLEIDAGDEVAGPVWAVFGDLMAGLVGAFVLLLLFALASQLELATKLQDEVRQHQIDAQRRDALERVLAVPLAAGRVTLDHGRIGIRGSVLFALNAADLQPEGRQLLQSLAAPLAEYLRSRDEILMVSGYTDDRQVRGGNRPFADNWELSAQRALTVTRALIEDGVPPAALFAAAFGAEQPIATNTDADGRSRNRRVEIAPTPRPARAGASAPHG